jgi:hypothetical protein
MLPTLEIIAKSHAKKYLLFRGGKLKVRAKVN